MGVIIPIQNSDREIDPHFLSHPSTLPHLPFTPLLVTFLRDINEQSEDREQN